VELALYQPLIEVQDLFFVGFLKDSLFTGTFSKINWSR
jgi:hypothetical protein